MIIISYKSTIAPFNMYKYDRKRFTVILIKIYKIILWYQLWKMTLINSKNADKNT